ncbi:MAG: sulfurtransferase FdhD, partial [Burkholderiales bacterium]
MKPITHLTRLAWRNGQTVAGERAVPEETPVAIVHDGSTAAVMMATPADLEEFAIGFSLSEGVIDSADDIKALEIVEGEHGVEARVWLKPSASIRQSARRRRLIGPTGCGLCG